MPMIFQRKVVYPALAVLVFLGVIFIFVLYITGLRPKYIGQKKWHDLSIDFDDGKTVSFVSHGTRWNVRMLRVVQGQDVLDMWGARRSAGATYVAVSIESEDGESSLPLHGKSASFLNVNRISVDSKDNSGFLYGGDGGFAYKAEVVFDANENGGLVVLDVVDAATWGWFRGHE